MNDNVVYIEGRNRMFDIILRYLYGFAKIHLRGIHINRFVNLCKARDIKLWDLEQKENEIFFFVASKDIAHLKEPALKTGSEVEILKEYGIRQFIRKNKKRIPFVIGFILFTILVYIQSLFIWEISVSGESDYTSDEILQHINEYYVQTGTPKSKVDCAELEKNLRKDFEDIMLKSVRILSNSASEELKLTVGSLIDIKDMLDTYEAEHESNLSRPMGAKNKPVQIPMTDNMIQKVDTMIDVAEKAILALEIAEFATLENQSEVKNYTVEIAEQFKLHHKDIDNEIQKYSNGWDISRLVKMDKDILRIAITELLYIKDAPLKVIVDEAVELAKKYSTEDSSSFVNGILAKVIVENGLKG